MNSSVGVSVGVPLAEVTRRDEVGGDEVVESLHLGHAVLTGADGEVLAAVGEPDRPLFVRSAAKPFQARACLETLTAEDALTTAELAVGWASHRGEPGHLEAVRSLLARSGTAPEDLTTPPAVPQADPSAAPSRLGHNCSGKHALFALAGQRLGVPRDRLLDRDSPLQRRILDRLAADLGPVAAVAVDGCGAPAVAVALTGLARGFARAASADDYRPIREAGFAHPGLVGGEGRLESALLGAGLVAKVGAEGVYGVGWTTADGSPRGFAVKATDGSTRGVAAFTLALLEMLGVVGPGIWTPETPLGGGVPVGSIRPTAAIEVLVDGAN
ncbi:MAG: asparaginase [Actinobacteria bacterium]|jgi:L-asparaginase II|nr:asparaginase [Actinomycetota bacterium]